MSVNREHPAPSNRLQQPTAAIGALSRKRESKQGTILSQIPLGAHIPVGPIERAKEVTGNLRLVSTSRLIGLLILLAPLLGCGGSTKPPDCQLVDGEVWVQLVDGVRADSAHSALTAVGLPYNAETIEDCFILYFSFLKLGSVATGAARLVNGNCHVTERGGMACQAKHDFLHPFDAAPRQVSAKAPSLDIL